MSEAAAKYIREAARLVSGDRAGTHGDLRAVHGKIASLWSAYLGVEITASQAALMLALMKIGRADEGTFNADDYIDVCGYAGIAAALREDAA